jgi:thymidine kinase
MQMNLQIYLGPMFAGKSSTIIRIVNRYASIGINVYLISHSADIRYSSEQFLWNHDSLKIPCYRWSKLMDFLETPDFEKSKILLIDEAQFFPDLKEFIVLAVEKYKKKVILFGLDGDADRKPFGQILDCIPLADDVFKLKAFCKLCGDGTEALFTFCRVSKKEQICVGGPETYMPLCRFHYLEQMQLLKALED